jgi:hypothetical protein
MSKLVLAVAALALAAPAAAQERPQFGIGVSITPEAAFSPTVEAYVPITFGQLRIEPSLGIFTADNDDGPDTSDITLGVGAFYLQRMAPAADLYFGGRLKLNFAHQDDFPGDDSGTDFLIAAAIGGEYYLVSRLSLGAEAQLGFYSESEVSGDDSGVFTTGLGFLRFYF